MIPCCRARLIIPKSNGPAKYSGKMVNRSKRIIRCQISDARVQFLTPGVRHLTSDIRLSQIQQPFRRIDQDSLPLGVNLDANTQDERDQKFAFTVSDQKQWRGAVILNLFDAAEGLTFSGDRLAADQVEIVVGVFRQPDQLIARNHHPRVSQFFRVIDTVAAGEFQRDAPFMRPRTLKVEDEEPSVRAFDVGSVESGEAFREIGQQIRDDLPAMALWTDDPRDADQIILFNIGPNIWAAAGAILFPVTAHSRISSTKRFLSFVPEALRTVRIARAVRPCLPMTLPRSPSATRNSSTVA